MINVKRKIRNPPRGRWRRLNGMFAAYRADLGRDKGACRVAPTIRASTRPHEPRLRPSCGFSVEDANASGYPTAGNALRLRRSRNFPFGILAEEPILEPRGGDPEGEKKEKRRTHTPSDASSTAHTPRKSPYVETEWVMDGGWVGRRERKSEKEAVGSSTPKKTTHGLRRVLLDERRAIRSHGRGHFFSGPCARWTPFLLGEEGRLVNHRRGGASMDPVRASEWPWESEARENLCV